MMFACIIRYWSSSMTGAPTLTWRISSVSALIYRRSLRIGNAEAVIIYGQFTLFARRVIAMQSLALDTPRIHLLRRDGRGRACDQCAANPKCYDRQTHGLVHVNQTLLPSCRQFAPIRSARSFDQLRR